MTFELSGRPIIVDFSPVTDFREATCRQYEENVCNRGGYCNFMHLKKISELVCHSIVLVNYFVNLFIDTYIFISYLIIFSFSPLLCQSGLKRQLFGRSKRRHSRSRSRSRSPHRHSGYAERPRGGRGFPRRGDQHFHDRGRRPRSPGRRGRSRSPGGRRNRSPTREGSIERRAKIEQWNKEREQGEPGRSNSSPRGRRNRSPIREGSAERRAMIEQWNREKEQAESGKSNHHFNDNENENGISKIEELSQDDH